MFEINGIIIVPKIANFELLFIGKWQKHSSCNFLYHQLLGTIDRHQTPKKKTKSFVEN